MIFNFKDDLLFIQILNILKQISCENKFINYLNLRRLFYSQTLLKAESRAPPSVPDVIDCAIFYVRLIYVVL